MKYVYYTSPAVDKKLCELFDIHYVPSEVQRIEVEVERKTKVSPANLGIDIAVPGKPPWNKGKKTGPLSEEHKKALSIAATGYVKTAEHRRKLSISLAGNKNGKKNTKPKSDEHRRKLAGNKNARKKI